jgi:hypothetical protein
MSRNKKAKIQLASGASSFKWTNEIKSKIASYLNENFNSFKVS